jgi:hypothetical protein
LVSSVIEYHLTLNLNLPTWTPNRINLQRAPVGLGRGMGAQAGGRVDARKIAGKAAAENSFRAIARLWLDHWRAEKSAQHVDAT